jgi:hypothetical protein
MSRTMLCGKPLRMALCPKDVFDTALSVAPKTGTPFQDEARERIEIPIRGMITRT